MSVLTSLQRKWPEEKIPVGIDTIRNFNVRAKVVGPSVRAFPFADMFIVHYFFRVCS